MQIKVSNRKYSWLIKNQEVKNDKNSAQLLKNVVRAMVTWENHFHFFPNNVQENIRRIIDSL